MTHDEKVRQLCEEYSKRVPRFTLSPEEADVLLNKYPTMVILEAMKRTGHTLRHKAKQGDAQKVFEGKLQFLLAEATAKGACKSQTTPQAASKFYEKITRVRQAFQDKCTAGDWTILDEEAKQFLKQRSEKIVLTVLTDLNKTYAEAEAQNALDEISWLLSQSPK